MDLLKLDRGQKHTINAHQADQLHLWDSPIDAQRQNLTLQDCNGNEVLRMYGLTHDQLANLYLEIAQVLQKSPDPTLHHLKQIHMAIGKLIDAVNTPEQDYTDGWGDA